jgi:hypothetical protein
MESFTPLLVDNQAIIKDLQPNIRTYYLKFLQIPDLAVFNSVEYNQSIS